MVKFAVIFIKNDFLMILLQSLIKKVDRTLKLQVCKISNKDLRL